MKKYLMKVLCIILLMLLVFYLAFMCLGGWYFGTPNEYLGYSWIFFVPIPFLFAGIKPMEKFFKKHLSDD